MTVRLEHANYTVSDGEATAAWMQKLFGWHIRWKGDATSGGQSIHVGSDTQYLALYTPARDTSEKADSYTTRGGLNHIAVVVDDIDAMEEAVKEAGFTTGNHADYEPGRRFYFHDHDDIEYEVVQYD
ncbi:VOC family protein [Roseobacter sp.]|uniref:VOC family protein n=1 Tax=Roseobacter sp. TaxID=1907202 RepID=UPI002966B0D1|nr:VOC family protein [Roseobacter sp.]MDW3182520.1 VOC family protein [Roseobacter sp.]